MHKCANMEFGLHHQVPSIESILGNIWSKKIEAQSKREEGDGASPAQTNLAGFTAQNWPVDSQTGQPRFAVCPGQP
jgi:hypothetical protein